MNHYGTLRHHQQQTVWHSLNRLMMALIAFAAVVLVLCAFLPELKKQRTQSLQVEQLKSELARQRDLLTQRTREVDLLNHNPAYLETIARDRLELMKEGETIFRIEQSPAPARDQSNFRKHE